MPFELDVPTMFEAKVFLKKNGIFSKFCGKNLSGLGQFTLFEKIRKTLASKVDWLMLEASSDAEPRCSSCIGWTRTGHLIFSASRDRLATTDDQSVHLILNSIEFYRIGHYITDSCWRITFLRTNDNL